MVISTTIANLNIINQNMSVQYVVYTKDVSSNVTKLVLFMYAFGPTTVDFGTSTKLTEAQLLLAFPSAMLVEAIVTP